MSTLREAAQDALTAYETFRDVDDIDGLDGAVDRLRAALAQPESRPCTCHPDDNPPQPCAQRYALTECKAQAVGAWAVECDGDLVSACLTETAAKLIAENMRETNRGRDFAWRVVPLLHTHPPRNEWREAVHDELVTTWTFSAENKDDPRRALRDIINWHVSVSLDPAISSDAQALIERGKAMRSGWRPASEPFGWVRASDAAAFGDSGTTETATLFSVEPGSVECVPLYAHPPSEEWRPASEPPEDGRDAPKAARPSSDCCASNGNYEERTDK